MLVITSTNGLWYETGLYRIYTTIMHRWVMVSWVFASSNVAQADVVRCNRKRAIHEHACQLHNKDQAADLPCSVLSSSPGVIGKLSWTALLMSGVGCALAAGVGAMA